MNTTDYDEYSDRKGKKQQREARNEGRKERQRHATPVIHLNYAYSVLRLNSKSGTVLRNDEAQWNEW